MPFGWRPPTLRGMDETYRMLGREHELDLEREACKQRVAARMQADGRAAKARAGARPRERAKRRIWVGRVPARLAALVR